MEEPKNSSSQFYQRNAGKIVLDYNVILCITLRGIDPIVFLPLNNSLERGQVTMLRIIRIFKSIWLSMSWKGRVAC